MKYFESEIKDYIVVIFRPLGFLKLYITYEQKHLMKIVVIKKLRYFTQSKKCLWTIGKFESIVWKFPVYV